MNKLAFIICTESNVISMTRYIEQNNYNYSNIDIFICNHTTKMYDYYKKIKELDIFNSVLFIKDMEIQNFKGIYRIKKILSRVLLTYKFMTSEKIKEDYNQVGIFNLNPFTVIFIERIMEKRHCEFIQLEEGLSTYFLEEKNFSFDKYKFICRFIKRNIFSLNNISKIYISNPNLYSGDSRTSLLRLNPLNNHGREIINLIFNYRKTDIFDENKYIFLDQPFLKEGFMFNYKEICDIITEITRNNVLFKLHPRTDLKEFNSANKKIYTNNEYPFSLICCNENINCNIFISVSSTAALDSIFQNTDNKNKIIFLYKIINDKKLNSVINPKFFKKLEEQYGEQIIIPNTLNELKEIIRNSER
ncbi:alpha-2,8-polysialyltransferase family protein [Clostridium gasigenes]|uniref:alpha-2,8-polysialyltransferase family protein n=1 Tax=Clostridium gasigenes TaxID=94869 RepID=UPI001C0C89A3|nr:alpha-2,8-polysialyltransferase family protein [Clostridium gasigenes]MBU3088278.1 alpha-2,8-polysialyltransferase family protein [Clostridium gasigenes]